MAILDKIEDIPPKQRLLIVVALLLILVGGYYQFIYAKQKVKIQALQSQLAKLNSELQDLRAISKKLNDFKGMITQLEAQLGDAQKQLPKQKEIPVLLKEISQFGKDQGLEFMSFRPSKEVQKGFYADVPINIVVNGPFHQLAKFFDDIIHYRRIIKLSNFNIGAPSDKDGRTILRTTCTATTFRYLEESEE